MSRRPSWTPSRRQVLIAGGLAGAATFAEIARAKVPTAERSGIAFGTVVSLKAAHSDRVRLERALDEAWREIVHVEEAASLFRPDSAISRLNREGRLDNPPERFTAMLNDALDVARLTGGAFDPTIQPLWKLYDRAYAEKRSATPEEIADAGALIGWEKVRVEDKRITLQKPGSALTLNGLAQGFATGRCLAVLREHGIENAFLDTGEFGVSGKREDDAPWTVAIGDPRNANENLALARPLSGVLATSGDYATTWSSDLSLHHILDPKTHASPLLTASVSVLAQSGSYADALATAMMVMGPDQSLALANRLTGVEVLIVTKAGARFATSGFPVVAGA